MHQPENQQSSQPTQPDILDPEVQYARRRRTALWMTFSLLSLALVIMAVGFACATRTETVRVAGYYPGIALSFGAFLGIVGIHLLENRRPMLVAAIIFISIGIIASFFCAIVDGIIASEFIDITPLQNGLCDYYSGHGYNTYYTEMMCHSATAVCKMKVRSKTCICCYLYNCGSSSDYHLYYEFTGVNGCDDVIHMYRLMWSSVVLNVIGVFLGIIAAALLGAYKDMEKPSPQVAPPSPMPPPQILYNPTHHMLTYAGFCPSGQMLPAYPNYPLPTQHNSSFQTPGTPQMINNGALPSSSVTSCPSEENNPPAQAPSQPPPQGAAQEPGGYMLTPNAPVLYGSNYNPCEKPPPYAC